MASKVLDCFPKLLKDNTNERLDGGCRLLQHLSSEIQKNGESKEFNHTFQRLVRGLGSSKLSSRKGFYTTLTVFLSMNPTTSVDKVFSIIDNELKTSSSSTKSEVADVNNGRILACGAIIRSGILKNSSVEDQKKVLECLFLSGKKRSYLNFESVSFIVEFLKQLDDDSLLPLWSIFEGEIVIPIKNHTLDSFYALLIIQDKFPQILTSKVLQKRLGHETIINKECIEDIVKILTDIPRIMYYKHPVYKLFCAKLAATDCLDQFWSAIDQCFIKPSKTDEHLGPELFNILLETTKDASVILTLLSPNFLRHMLKRFSFSAIHRNDDVSAIFKKALVQLVTVVSEQTKPKVHFSILKKLILYPGDLMIEKITNTKVLQLITSHLNIDGVKKLANLYREIAANTKLKEKANSVIEPWTNNERTYVLQLLSTRLMSHKAVVSDHEWRLDQLKFLFNHGLCEMPNVGIELAPHIKESFYRALDTKLESLGDLKTVLSSLVTYIDKTVFQNSEIKLRTPLDEAATEAWKKMRKLVKKLEKDSKNDQNITTVFHIMDLHMGLQLFSDPEMAISSINELQSCYDHLREKKQNNSTAIEEEPEWVEVVVDLLLSLLSRQSHLLRSLVGCVFPHICPHLTANAIHQILAIIDVKSGKNPLTSSKNDNEDSESDLDDEDDDEDEEEEPEAEDKNDEEDSSDEKEIEEESDSDVEESDVEDETVTDRLRLAVRQALGDMAMQTDDEDIDVDNINEEEGKRLDESLATAFKMLKENRKTQMKKQEKSAQALTHFRIRVIDLLECYLDTSPSMALALDMLVPLFALLEFSIKDQHQKPLENRVRTCLKKLSAVKKFKSVEDVDGELLTTVLKTLIEKGERSAAVCQEMGDKLAQCCVFLVRCSQQINASTDSFIRIFGEHLTAYFKKRDCILPSILFKSLLQLTWVGNWHLAPLLVSFAFDESVRSFRRGQALDYLKTFYNNTRMINSEEHKVIRLKMEKNLCLSSISVLVELGATQDTENGKQIANVGKDLKQKFVCHLLLLLFAVQAHHIPEAWNWKKIGESMAMYRSATSLSNDAKSAYNKLANRIHAPAVPQKQQVRNPRLNSENHDSNSDEDELQNGDGHIGSQTETSDKPSKKNDKKKKKNSSKKKDKQKLKKEARELRATAMSEGLESFDFSSVTIPNGISPFDEPMENGNSEETDSTGAVKKQKRPHTKSTDVPSKKKKKNAQNGD